MSSKRSSKPGGRGVGFSASAARRMNGEWSPAEQEVKSQRSLQKTTDAMKKFEAEMSATMASIQARGQTRTTGNTTTTTTVTPSHKIGDFKTTLPPSFQPPAFRSNQVGAQVVPSSAHMGQMSQMSASTSPLFQNNPRASKSFSEFATANQTVNDLQQRTSDTQTHIKERLAAITDAMKKTSITGMPQPSFQPHTSITSAKAATPIPAMGGLSGAASSAMMATPGATLLTSNDAVAGLQAVDKLLQTMQDMMGSTHNIGNTLQSLVTDDRYPTDWSFSLPFHSIMDYDHYREFRDRYYVACWKKAGAKTHWISGSDLDIGQYVTSKLTTGETLSTKAAPFEIYCSVYDAQRDRLLIGGNRQIPSPTNNGAVMWEPVLASFVSPSTAGSDNNVATLDITFFAAVTQSFSPMVTQLFGTGMCIKDIQLHPTDGSIYLLMNYLSTVNPAGGGVMAASSSVIHLLSNGTMDPHFDFLAVTQHYGKMTVVGVKMALSLKNQSIFLITHKESSMHAATEGPSILRIHSSSGKVLSDNAYELDTYLCDVIVTPDEKRVLVTGYEMVDVTKKSSIGILNCFDPVTGGSDQPLQEVKSFGNQGTTYLEIHADQASEYPFSRGLRIILTEDGIPIIYGNAIKSGMRDEHALQIWSVDSSNGDVLSAVTWSDPDFPKASLCVDQLLYDANTEIITAMGGIRFFPFQCNSTEIWIHQFHFKTNEFVSMHLPCTPDLYAQSRAAVVVKDRIVFQANMHVSKLKWGRQAMFGSVPSILPSKTDTAAADKK